MLDEIWKANVNWQ